MGSKQNKGTPQGIAVRPGDLARLTAIRYIRVENWLSDDTFIHESPASTDTVLFVISVIHVASIDEFDVKVATPSGVVGWVRQGCMSVL